MKTREPGRSVLSRRDFVGASTLGAVAAASALSDIPYVKERFRINKEGYMVAPTKPGLGLEIDRDILDEMTREVEV